MASTFLTATWKNLIMANYVVDPAVLQPHVPFGTELDYWNGKTYVSLVGFMFLNTKVLGIPIPFHRNFEEVNLRFYVRYQHEGEWRRGVVFVKEIVPKAAITLVANTLYGEHYMTCPMKNSLEETAEKLKVSYSWQYQKQWNSISVTCPNTPKAIAEGSEAEFITEHYWGYTQLKENKTSQYEVGHPKWDVYDVTDYNIDCDYESLYGKELAQAMATKPVSVFMAKGSEIFVKKGHVIK
ncbi:MAG: DUF2071 domain-containing protein [Aureispira sp.]|nr:DUF2071 domain-containing protein [Aureispira sp.]